MCGVYAPVYVLYACVSVFVRVCMRGCTLSSCASVYARVYVLYACVRARVYINMHMHVLVCSCACVCTLMRGCKHLHFIPSWKNPLEHHVLATKASSTITACTFINVYKVMPTHALKVACIAVPDIVVPDNDTAKHGSGSFMEF